jgi:hypothetical protein
MTELPTASTRTCPTWCRTAGVADAGRSHGQDVDGVHAHVSEDIVVGDPVDPVTVRMTQLVGSDQVRVVLGRHVVDLAGARSIAHALSRLTAAAQLAEPGLGFVEVLAARAGAGTGQLALAAGIDVERVRTQRAGGQVLSLAELDRLAMATAQLVPLRASTGEVEDEGADDESSTDVPPTETSRSNETEWSTVADMTELAVLAEGPDAG